MNNTDAIALESPKPIAKFVQSELTPNRVDVVWNTEK